MKTGKINYSCVFTEVVEFARLEQMMLILNFTRNYAVTYL